MADRTCLDVVDVVYTCDHDPFRERKLHFYLPISVGLDVLFATADTLLCEDYGDDLTEDHHRFLV